MDVKKIIGQVAKDHNTTPEEVRAEMIKAILAAKDNPNFQAMFGEGVIPAPEVFIETVARKIMEN